MIMGKKKVRLGKKGKENESAFMGRERERGRARPRKKIKCFIATVDDNDLSVDDKMQLVSGFT